MGNRAVISFSDKSTATGIYVHWNGGPESIDGFLSAARELGISGHDESYALARLTQLIGNFFGGTSSIGIGPLRTLDCDNHDNGLYIIGPDLNVKSRKFARADSEYRTDYRDGVATECIKHNRDIFARNA